MRGSAIASRSRGGSRPPDGGAAMPTELNAVRSAQVDIPVPRAPTDRGVALLAGKLFPPEVAPATVLRPRLVSLLARAAQHSALTLVSGPAGSGKTTLAASWLRAQPAGAPIGWVTLDAYDDDPATFWTYVLEALSGAGVDVGRVVRPVPGEAAASVGPARRSRWPSSPTPRRGPVVLVLDQADHLSSRSILTGLDLLLRNAGRRLHLVMVGRCDPGLPLHQYRLDGSMAEIRSAQLAFTPEETRELFHAAGVRVSAPVAQALCEQAEGWAVGLRLAVAPLKQGTDPEQLVISLAHDDGSVAQYLFAEVLANQPALGPPLPDAHQRHRGALARARRPAVRAAQQRPDPRRARPGKRLRGAVSRRTRRIPHPPALPGDAAGAARLHRTLTTSLGCIA